MYLDTISMGDLSAMLHPHKDEPAWPNLENPEAKNRAVEYAKKYGIWDKLTQEFEKERPLRVSSYNFFRDFRRTGSRARDDSTMRAEIADTETVVMALWLGHPGGTIDELHDRLWAWCDRHTWVPGCHEYCRTDLFSTRVANLLSEAVWLFRDKIEGEVRDRVKNEVQRRVLDPVYDYRNADWWRTADMNWNPVCNGNAISAALYHFADDTGLLATYLHPIIPRLLYSIHGFLDDGSCREGAGYWAYGFGHHVDAAIVLSNRTGGKLNLMDGEKMEKICRFPLATEIDGPVRARFGDNGNGYVGAGVALRVNQFYDIPELYEIAETHSDGALALKDWRDLAIYDGQKATGKKSKADSYLPLCGFAKVRTAATGDQPATLTALAGRNDFPHNHNDIGSFVYYRDGIDFITDIGGPIYTAKTFGPQRYEILHCRSYGHSVPLIDGQEQPQGSQYYGEMQVEGLNEDGEKRVTIDMTHAYDIPSLKSLVRTLVLKNGRSLDITDTFEFTETPKTLEEAFTTYENAEVVDDGRAVRIGPAENSAVLRIENTPGKFNVQDLGEESKSWHSKETVKRIAFTPDNINNKMAFRFTIT